MTRPERAQQRQGEILDAAAKLFHERGYHGTTLDDVGRAIGITGAAIYRHFKDKEAVLLAVLRRGWDARQQGVKAAKGLPAAEALRVLVRSFVVVAIEHRLSLAIYNQERRYLPVNARHWLARDTKKFNEAWVQNLQEIRPELSEAEINATVNAALGLISSVGTYKLEVPHERLVSMLEEMAYAAMIVDFSDSVEGCAAVSNNG